MKIVTIAGKKYIFENVKRIKKMPWQEQFEAMQEDYEDLDWIHVTTDYINICYTRKKEGVS